MVIEQIPLTFVIHNTVVIGPTAVCMLSHDESLVFIWAHRILAHSISENFGVFTHIRIRKVVVAVVFKGERTFSLTTGQAFETVHPEHLKLAVTPLNSLLGIVVGKFLHIVFEFGTAPCPPEYVSVTVGCQKDTRVNSVDSLDRLRFRDEWSLRTVRYGYTHTKTAHGSSRSRRKIEIVFSVPLNTVRCPHGIGVGPYPRHFVLGDNHAMVSPVGKILRREYMIILHAEPVLTLSLWRYDVMRRVKVYLVIEHSCRRVGGELITNNRVLSHQPSTVEHQQGESRE